MAAYKQNQVKYEMLRQKHNLFIYDSYKIERDSQNTKITYKYIMDDITFQPTWTFSSSYFKRGIDEEFFENLVFNLGMVELVSYWKAACPKNVQILCGELSSRQVAFFKKLYFNGLGEFFYTNGINADFDDFMDIKSEGKKHKFSPLDDDFSGSLIPVGGGKDSIVTLELLKEEKEKNACYIVNPRGASLDSCYTAGFEDEKIIKAYRTIDPELLRLNSLGYLNGHTPFSAMLAFSCLIFAYIQGKKYIVLSNESSANESNVLDTNINHQYSKGIEFENDFREYVKNYITGKIIYFSLLRPLSEWQIVKEFSKHKKYFNVFKSCNVGSKKDVWCANCPKCLYVYIMLSAHLDREEVERIFGKNMLDDFSLKDTFDGLICDFLDKPFECVGTKGEINLALRRTISKYKGKLPKLLEYYKENYMDEDVINYDLYFDEAHNVPKEFLKYLGKVE